jgi:hypothetical protein
MTRAPQEGRRDVTGLVYLLHFDRPIGNTASKTGYARHYTGKQTEDLPARLEAHRAGRGARLMEVSNAAGIGFTLARTWPGTKSRERQIKTQGGASRHCPECGVTPRDQQKEAGMFGSKRRQEARQQAEANALFREADRLADVADLAPNYRRQITSDRAARVMGEIGEPLARDARASGPELKGGALDREIDRLAQLYPEPGLSEPAAVADPGRYLEAGQ